MILTQLAKEAGVPDGVLNVVHGSKDAVNFICDAPEIRAISFVGGDAAGRHIHERGSRNGKRVQSNMSAKNHATILPDADKQKTIDQLIGAAFGASGQRCMAISAAVFVGDAKNWSSFPLLPYSSHFATKAARNSCKGETTESDSRKSTRS